MRTLVLGVEETHRLTDQGLPALLKYVQPEQGRIVAVEDAGKIVAHVGVVQVTHFEGLYLAPECRGNAGVFRALIREAFAIPHGRGETFAFGGAEHGDARMEKLCHQLGGHELPVKFFAIGV